MSRTYKITDAPITARSSDGATVLEYLFTCTAKRVGGKWHFTGTVRPSNQSNNRWTSIGGQTSNLLEIASAVREAVRELSDFEAISFPATGLDWSLVE